MVGRVRRWRKKLLIFYEIGKYAPGIIHTHTRAVWKFARHNMLMIRIRYAFLRYSRIRVPVCVATAFDVAPPGVVCVDSVKFISSCRTAVAGLGVE